jgi:hypothetical protein
VRQIIRPNALAALTAALSSDRHAPALTTEGLARRLFTVQFKYLLGRTGKRQVRHTKATCYRDNIRARVQPNTQFITTTSPRSVFSIVIVGRRGRDSAVTSFCARMYRHNANCSAWRGSAQTRRSPAHGTRNVSGCQPVEKRLNATP